MSQQNNITSVLVNEHKNILKVIDIIFEKCTQMESSRKMNSAFFNDVIDFIRNYADGFHHVKEEDILFRQMLQNLDNMHCNPIPVMLNEHDAGREYVKGMIKAVETKNLADAIENARGYGLLMKNHIYKEDNVLYPMAEESLDNSQKTEINIAYSQVSAIDYLKEDINSIISRLASY